jgi:hypothetical protein
MIVDSSKHHNVFQCNILLQTIMAICDFETCDVYSSTESITAKSHHSEIFDITINTGTNFADKRRLLVRYISFAREQRQRSFLITYFLAYH